MRKRERKKKKERKKEREGKSLHSSSLLLKKEAEFYAKTCLYDIFKFSNIRYNFRTKTFSNSKLSEF